jgi:putative tryptophan/tyrosine transport system substrate-binding protein
MASYIGRRKFLATLGGAAAAWPFAARAQRPPPVLGMIGDLPLWDHFRKGMRDLGYIEGQNVKFEFRTGEGEPARFAEAAREFASIPVDVMVVNGSTAVPAAQMATRTIPIVMIGIGDPVRAGFVASLARPGGNITGNSILGPEVAPKRLQLLKEVIPSVARVALLWNPNNASNVVLRDEIEAAMPALGMRLISVEARTVAELDTKLTATLSEHPDALLVTGDPFHQLHVQKIVDFLANNRIPGMFQIRENVLAGGLMSYGASLPDLFRRGATYVHKILQGTKPSDLPIEQPIKFDLVINLKTAKTLGLTVPLTLQASADEVIE